MHRDAALLVLCLAALLGCTQERIARTLYGCSGWDTEIATGDWNGLRIGQDRRAVLQQLRELGFGGVRGLGERLEVQASADVERLGVLAGTARWEIWREASRPAVIVRFAGDGYGVTEVEVLRQEGNWVDPLLRVRDRSELSARVRALLDAGAAHSVVAVQAAYRAAVAESEESALAGLSINQRWESGREQWWGRQALTLTFDGDRLARIQVARVLFLH